MSTTTANGIYTTLSTSHKVESDSAEQFAGSNKSSRWLIKRLEKAKESLRLSREDDDRSYKAKYAKLVAKRATLKEREPSSSRSLRISRLSQELKYFKPTNSTKTEFKLVKLQQLKKDIRKLKQQTNEDSELVEAWPRPSSNPPPSPKKAKAEEKAEEAVEEAEEEDENNLFPEKRKKKRRMVFPEDE